jgi:hypothetical protein
MVTPTRASESILMLVMTAMMTLNTQGQSQGPVLAEPGISPDGREVAFVSGGDIWTAPLGGGAPAIARLPVSHPATASGWIIYTSNVPMMDGFASSGPPGLASPPPTAPTWKCIRLRSMCP